MTSRKAPPKSITEYINAAPKEARTGAGRVRRKKNRAQQLPAPA
ncbi:MAG TPA: hypothetical protein VGK99_11475 [Acidobacteriota bacterium]